MKKYKITPYARYLLHSSKDVFARPRYIAVALVAALSLLAIMILLPNYAFVKYILSSGSLSAGQKFTLLAYSLGAFQTNASFAGQITMLLVSGLAGINIAFLSSYMGKRLSGRRAAGMSAVGMMSGMLGIGCSACGSVILSTVFGVTSAGTIISLLPLRGFEFSIVSILIILGSTVYVAKKLQAPALCEVKKNEPRRE